MKCIKTSQINVELIKKDYKLEDLRVYYKIDLFILNIATIKDHLVYFQIRIFYL